MIVRALGVGSHRFTALAASGQRRIMWLVTTFAALPAFHSLAA